MSRASRNPFGVDDLTRMLGKVVVPGELDDFIEALQRRWGNVMRRRRDVAPQDLPVPSDVIPWYLLGHRPTAESPRPSRTLAYASADFFVQDAGSLLALSALHADTDLLRGKLICDLCAAPGGKASALVEAVDSDGDAASEGGFVLANEVIRARLGALQLNLARTGSDRYAISSMDPEALADQLPGAFDAVVVDAPCSGQTLVARGKQSRSSFSINQIAHSASRQRRILDAAVRLLRPHGLLVYSTCTFAEAENESQVSRLIEAGNVTPVPIERLEAYRSGDACYRLWPHLHDCAGSFAASLQVDGGNTTRLKRGRHNGAAMNPPDELKSWFDAVSDSSRLWQNDSLLIGWPSDAPPWASDVATMGPELAHRTGHTWKPSHAAALRRVLRGRARARIELDPRLAVSFLRGEVIPVEADGWQVACFGGRPLGWIKGINGMGKNHLPASARITGDLSW